MLDQYEIIIRQNNEYIDNHFAPLALKVGTHYVPNHQLMWSKNIIDKGYIREKFVRPSNAESMYYKYISDLLEDPLEQLELLNQIQYRYRISVVHLSIVDELLENNHDLLERFSEAIKSCP
jgi:hypothetical protein